MRAPRTQGGFTLIEIMIAIAILGIAASTFAMTLSPRQRALADVSERDAAVALAADVVEDMLATPYSDRTRRAQQWSARGDLASPPDADVEVILSEPRSGVTSIRVDVSWKAHNGDSRSVRLDSARGNY